MLDGGRLRRVQDALEESVSKDRPARLTEEGVSQLRRAEAILADAARQIARHTEYELSQEEGLRARRDREREAETALLAIEEQRLELARTEAKIREGRARHEIDERVRRMDRLATSSLGYRREPSLALERAAMRLSQPPASAAPTAESEPKAEKTDWVPIIVIAALGATLLLAIAISSGDRPAPRRPRR